MTNYDKRLDEMSNIVMTSWCGGSTGNKKCNYNCKACLIFSGKARLIKHDDKSLILTYKIVDEKLIERNK